MVGEDRSIDNTNILRAVDDELAVDSITHGTRSSNMVLRHDKLADTLAHGLGVGHIQICGREQSLADLVGDVLGLLDLAEHLEAGGEDVHVGGVLQEGGVHGRRNEGV